MSARKMLPTASVEHVECSRCGDVMVHARFALHECPRMSPSDRAHLAEGREERAAAERRRAAVDVIVGAEADFRAASHATAARANAQPADPSKRTVQIDGRHVDLYLVRLPGATCWCWVSPAHYTAPEGELYRAERSLKYVDGLLVDGAGVFVGAGTIMAKHARHAENRARVLFGERARAVSVGSAAHPVPASVADEAFARAADPEPAIVAPSPARPASSLPPAHAITIEERGHRGMPWRSVCSCGVFASEWYPARFQAQRDGDAHAARMAGWVNA